MNPTQTALQTYTALLAEAAEPEALLRSSAEAVSRYDTEWKTVATRGEDATQAMADFLLIASAHLDALKMHGARRPAMSTMLSMLISVDMSKADTGALALQFAALHRRFFTSCLELVAASDGDSFMSGHARAILAIEAVLFAAAAGAVPQGALSPIDEAAYAGLADAARAIPAPEHMTVRPDSPAEALIDIMSRLHAMGSQD